MVQMQPMLLLSASSYRHTAHFRFFQDFHFQFFFQINTKLQRSFHPQEVLYLLLVFEKINNYSCRKQNKIQNSAFIVFVVIKSKFELGSLFTDTSVADACGN